MSHYAAANYQRHCRMQVAAPLPTISPANIALRTLDPILKAWDDANPHHITPQWYSELEDYCRVNYAQADKVCALFIKLTEGVTNTHKLTMLGHQAVVEIEHASIDLDVEKGKERDWQDDRQLQADLRRGG